MTEDALMSSKRFLATALLLTSLWLPTRRAVELTLEGFFEYYLTPRTSIRTGLGYSNPEFDREDEDSLRYIRIPLDVVYNREGGKVHPFVGAGIGAYFLQFKDNGRNVGDSEDKLGATLLGGIEYFTSRTVSIKGELRYHIVSDILNGSLNPDGAAITIGLKKSF
jgi:hypothetical protein